MLHKLKQLKSDGFTIIEVMIVLAIAGLIMLIVFLAVPALQRNSHNTSIKNDVAGLLAGVNEYIDNNNGTPPTTVSNGTASSIDIGVSSAGNTATVKLGYIDASVAGNVTLGALASSPTAPPAVGKVAIYTKAVCGTGANANKAVTGSSSRNVVALYTLEGGALQCQAS